MRFFYLILLFLISCTDKPQPPDDPLPDHVTYSSDIYPLFLEKCKQCHNETVPYRNWLIYETAYGKRDLIRLRISNRTMPVGLTITERQRNLIIKWVDQGANK